ncbi:MAG: glutamate--tRNA ligase, partial [Chloroflexi bacterium]|nr:glutamate--tRNA ligase [Chloroflexota bacterium]
LPEYEASLFENPKSKSSLESSKTVLEAVIPLLKKQETFSNAALFETLKAFATESGFKVGTTMWPIRTALSGLPASAGGATELAALLGKEETLIRLEKGLAKLS